MALFTGLHTTESAEVAVGIAPPADKARSVALCNEKRPFCAVLCEQPLALTSFARARARARQRTTLATLAVATVLHLCPREGPGIASLAHLDYVHRLGVGSQASPQSQLGPTARWSAVSGPSHRLERIAVHRQHVITDAAVDGIDLWYSPGGAEGGEQGQQMLVARLSP